MPVRVIENHAAIARLLTGEGGAVARDLARRAIRVQNQAKLNATGGSVPGANNPEGRGPRVDTGRLRASIAWDIRESRGTIVARIGTNVPYGFYLETGLRGGRTYPFLKPALAAAR